MTLYDLLVDLVKAWQSAMLRGLWVSVWACLLVILAERALTSATAKSWLWRLFFVKLLTVSLLPILFVIPVLPAWNFGRSDETPSFKESYRADMASSSISSPLPDSDMPMNIPLSRANQSSTIRVANNSDDASPFSAVVVLFMLWCFALVGLVVLQVVQWFRTRWVSTHSISPLTLEPEFSRSIRTITSELKRPMGVARLPEIRISASISSPMLVGYRRPRILIPLAFRSEFGKEDTRMAIAHELAHLVRRDLLWNGLVKCSHLLFFFNPCVWYAIRRYRWTQESACDSLAIRRARLNRTAFANLLLRVAHTSPFVGKTIASVAFVRQREFLGLVERVNAMKNLSTVQPNGILAMLVPVFAASFLLAPITLGQSTDDGGKRTTKSSSSNKSKKNSKESSPSSPSSSNGANGSNATAQSFGSSQGGAVSSGSSASGFASGGSASSGGSSFGGGGSSSGPGFAFGGASAGASVQGQGQPQPSYSPGNPQSNRIGSSNQSNTTVRDGVTISRSSQNDEEGVSTRVNVVERDREITIIEDSDGIEVTIRGTRRSNRKNTRSIEADSAEDLKKKDSEAFRLYERYMLDNNRGGPSVPGNPNEASNPAQDMMREQLRQMMQRDELDPTTRGMLQDLINRLPQKN